MYINNFGKLLKYERKAWGMSQRRLAYLSHTDVETIQEIESGKIKNPDFFLVLQICDVLQISIYDFIKKKKSK